MVSVGICSAKELDISFGQMTLHLPFQNVDATYLWDFVENDSLVGAETPVVTTWKLIWTVGGFANVDTGNGTPFGSVNAEVPPTLFKEKVTLGLWWGYDFDEDHERGGVKASLPLW
jgi:hypothetical protein